MNERNHERSLYVWSFGKVLKPGEKIECRRECFRKGLRVNCNRILEFRADILVGIEDLEQHAFRR